ncbi:hypothetical protein MPSEU_000187100 [Mayamaea pseudoterrestris]|nr:hypothetical protein MPSEU_000187100 [Mayamaea pseudoterrestris]
MMRRIRDKLTCLAFLFIFVTVYCLVTVLHHASLLGRADASKFDSLLRIFAASSKQQKKIPHSRNDYIQDNICSGCRHAIVHDETDGSPVTRCGLLIHEQLEDSHSSSLTIEQVTKLIAKKHLIECKQCRSCNAIDRRYWRYDRIFSPPQNAWTMRLPSVPREFRIPDTAIHNLTAYFTNDSNAYPNREYLFDYNPSLVVLPYQLSYAPSAVYLASFRVSNRHFCLHPFDRQLMMRNHKTKAQDWLGLAILDESMNILHDVTLDVSKLAGFQNGGVEDYRLFVLPTATTNNSDKQSMGSISQIYIASNDMIAPIWIQDAPAGSIVIPRAFQEASPTSTFSASIRPFVSCAPCSKPRGLCGKNFNYFANATGSMLVEIWPSPPHTCRPVNIDEPCQREQDPVEHIVDENRSIPSSFATVEELNFPRLAPEQVLLTRGRGGACCIEMEHPQTRQHLLVGVSHSKTPSQRKGRLPVLSDGNASKIIDNHYLSQLYAFENVAPYRIVALSGLFCFGFPSEREQQAVPIAKVTLWRKLAFGQEFDCPRIHFVSGITLAAGDSKYAIIAYGINDCVSRFVKVSIKELQQILFDGKT